MHYLEYFPNAHGDAIRHLHEEKQRWINQPKKGFLRYQGPLASINHIKATWHDFSGDIVQIGKPEELTSDNRQQVLEVMRNFMPWRKGPFNVFGIDIDAEWRSERKWNRLLPELPPLDGRLVADIGCNNGYYMFRTAFHKPSFILGFEPYVHHYYTFQALNGFAGQDNLAVEPFGVEHVHLFPECFDVVFLLGIIYHRPSPVDTLRDIYSALKHDGTLLLETQAIPGDEPVALFPEKTYAKVPGTWFVPTGPCVYNWLQRIGFRKISLFCKHPMSSEEQRRTEWMAFESYEDFIDSENSKLTIEGYPSPWRMFFKAVK